MKIDPSKEIIYPFKEEAFVTKTLSEKRISLDYLDTNRRQTLEDFSNYTKPIFFFSADDFLILINEQVESELQNNHFVDLHQVSQFGWYYEKRHRVNTQIFASTDSIKINNLLQLNPQLRIDSFDKLRDNYKVLKTLNVFSGALALCYHCFKSDYDNFFSKLTVEKSSLKVALSELDSKNDFPILLQLLLVHNPNDSGKNREVFGQEIGLHLLFDFLSASFRYFYSQTYSMSDFLSFLSRELPQNSEYSTLIKGFEDLKELYVQKGLSVTPPNKLIAATKEFLDIAKTESDQLRSFLEGDHSRSKTAIFLLGMLHLGDRLEEQFEFNNFIPSLVDIFVRHTKDIKNTDGIIEFDLDQSLTERNSPLTCVAEYLDELRRARQLLPVLNKLRRSNLVVTDFIETDSAINSLKNDIEELKNDKKKLESKKNTLQSDIQELEKQITTLQSEKDRLKSEVALVTLNQLHDADKDVKSKTTTSGKNKAQKGQSGNLFSQTADKHSTDSTESSAVQNNTSKEKTAEHSNGV
jgi:FtsZ-binding cell division protein ZapB